MARRPSEGSGWALDQGSESGYQGVRPGSTSPRSIGDLSRVAHSLSETTPLLRTSKTVEDTRRWKSIRVMYVTMFIGSIGFSIVLSSVWPFLQQIDPCVSSSFLGLVVAAYSVGQLIASPLFGWWANRSKASLMPIVVSLVINFVGCMMYGFSGALPGHDMTNGWFMLGSRFIIGFGAGSVSVVRAYVSSATTMEERTGAMANISAAQSMGFIIGPGLAAAFRPVGEVGVTINAIQLQLNMYTAPSFLGALLALINICVLLKWFTECTVDMEASIQEKANRTIQDESEEVEDFGSSIGSRLLPCCGDDDKGVRNKRDGVDYMAAFICIVLFFVVLFIFSVFEVILTPLSMDEFGWSGEEATLYCGILLLSSGTMAIFTFMIVKILAKRFDERTIFVGGLLICCMAFILYAPYSKGSPPLNFNNGTFVHRKLIGDLVSVSGDDKSNDYVVEDDGGDDFDPFEGISHPSTVSWHGVSAAAMLPYGPDLVTERAQLVASNSSSNSSSSNSSASGSGCQHENRNSSLGGCLVTKYKWCRDQHHLHFIQFLGGCVLMAVGYPTCAVMVYAIFSKILGPFPQGTMMGWLTAAGSAARAVGPLIVSLLYSSQGPRVAFLCTSGLVASAIVLVAICHRRLIPYQIMRRRRR